MSIKSTPVVFILILLLSFNINAQTAISPNTREIGVDEHLDEIIPGDITLTGENGQMESLEQLVDKPTIINLVYFRCPGICSPLMEGLADVMGKVDLELGKDYQVMTISFDPREDMELGKRKKSNYLNLMSNPEPARENWKFFVGDSMDIARLTDAVGFRYISTGLDFQHPAVIIMISPDRKITRYLNGTYFLPFEVTMALTEASEGISAPTANRILQYCFSYDPKGQTYVLNMTRVAAPFISLMTLVIVLILVFRGSRKRKQQIAE